MNIRPGRTVAYRPGQTLGPDLIRIDQRPCDFCKRGLGRAFLAGQEEHWMRMPFDQRVDQSADNQREVMIIEINEFPQ